MDPFLGEIRIFGFTFAPQGWALCDGSLISIQQNTALFSLLGTTYGGNGIQTFGLPDLRGRFPMSFGQGPGLSFRQQGQLAGREQVTLSSSNMPAHNHTVSLGASSGLPTQTSPANALLAGGVGSAEAKYTSGAADVTLAPATSALAGNGLPFDIMNPYVVMNFCIAMQGIYPSRP